ncbi:Transmembrane protease serine 11F [Porites harrisoni]
MQFRVQMLILLSCFVAICHPELVFGTKTAKTSHKIINLHRSNESVSNAHTRIIGGIMADMNKWKWYAALVHTKNYHIFCGGSLIKARWILTAAHCVCGEGTDTFIVWMGAYKAPQAFITNESQGKAFFVERVILHEKYDPVSNTHDIALIKLKSDARIKGISKTVKMPMKKDANLLEKHTQCVVTGFGDVDDNENQPKYLQETRVSIVPLKECRDQYILNGYKANSIDNTMLCAGLYGGRHDSCQGDSGGPLVCRHDDLKYYLYGVVSWGDGCGIAKQFGVYTNVIQFLDWIKEKRNKYQ